jgi:hypothetical protein
VADGLAKNEYPLKLEVQRPKTGVEYYTFVGKDGIESLRAYIADMKSRGVVFASKSPLFIQERGKARIRTHNVQEMMKELAVRTGLVDGENNGNDFCPLGPHALRESFGSIMTNAGVPDTVVNFWLGHEIGDMARAYQTVQFEELKRMYIEREPLISIAPKADVEKIRTKLKDEIRAESDKVQSLVNSLATENLEAKSRMARMELENTDLKRRIQKTEEKLTNIERMIRDLKKQIPES